MGKTPVVLFYFVYNSIYNRMYRSKESSKPSKVSICPKGQIERVAYTTKKNVHVAAECVKDRGLPGKTPESRKIPFRNLAFAVDDLGKYGYNHIVNKNAVERHQALSLAIQNYGTLPVLRKINVLDILNRNANKNVSGILESDKNWIEKTYYKK